MTFRAFSLALTIVLCICGWSKAHAEPRHYTFDNDKIVIKPPFEFTWKFVTIRRSEIPLPKPITIATWSTVACTAFPQCRRIVGDKILRLGKALAH
ncbi:hypothetical protein CQ12_10700 [Bradyrhizobium jicamae]|uniref:Uncharacterized protein n=1 Tax=Bradyrhizobium jicamae TaxID=280332 RepID=A0A0R3M3R5_9BRAD|nr:hypothetical protein [Bradyrhizobium jicamae]KRR14593.1 hypothetical protein CQ12_10700 [Bradyrhizobium jicamae]